MKRLPFMIVFAVFMCSCTKNTTPVNSLNQKVISETQKQRDLCLDWYAYRIDTSKAISNLNLKTEKESDLMVYCDFFKNVADTN